jgi:hypothetical protein
VQSPDRVGVGDPGDNVHVQVQVAEVGEPGEPAGRPGRAHEASTAVVDHNFVAPVDRVSSAQRDPDALIVFAQNPPNVAVVRPVWPLSTLDPDLRQALSLAGITIRRPTFTKTGASQTPRNRCRIRFRSSSGMSRPGGERHSPGTRKAPPEERRTTIILLGLGLAASGVCLTQCS